MRTDRNPTERFKAEPLPTENSYRVTGSWGTVEAFRVSQGEAETLAITLNALPLRTHHDHAYEPGPFKVCRRCGGNPH